MKTIEVRLSIGYANASRHSEIEVEDYATEQEIYEMAKEWADEHIEISWEEAKP